jgi:hypothetical protein
VVTNTHGSITSYPTIVTVDLSPPTIVSAIRPLLPVTQVSVLFSKTMNPSTAANKSNYAINNGVTISSASLSSDQKTVVLTTSPISGEVTNVLTVNGVQDSLGNTIAANSQLTINAGSDIIHAQDNSPDQLLVLEAEDYNQNISPSADGYSWAFTTTPDNLQPTDANTNYSGRGVMEAQPKTGTVNRGSTVAGPELGYKVYFSAPGTNYVWVRGVGDAPPGPSLSRSIQIGLDGSLVENISGFPQGAGYTWLNTAIGSPSGPLVVTTPGLHVINAWMRQDGFDFDKLLITSNPNYSPTNLGPPESALAGPAITVTRSGSNLSLSWFGPGTLQSSTNVTGPYADVPSATNPQTVTPSGTHEFFRVRP